jgi:hypothetical protein
MPRIKVAHKKTIERKNDTCCKASCPRDQKGTHKSVHKKTTQYTVKHHGVSISYFRRKKIVEEAQWIKHRCLDICNERRPGEEIGIPEWYDTFIPYIIINEFLPWIELENKIRAIQTIPGKNDPPPEGYGQENDYDNIGSITF